MEGFDSATDFYREKPYFMRKSSLSRGQCVGSDFLQLRPPDRQFDFDWIPETIRNNIRKQPLDVQSYVHIVDAYYNDVLH